MSAPNIRQEIAAIFSGLQNHADDLAVIFANEGIPGARAALLKISLDMANALASRLTIFADDAPEYDPPMDETRKETLQ